MPRWALSRLPRPLRPAPEVPISTSTAERQVGPREPCPCGSGRRYKACHGRPGGPPDFVARPFAGLAGEPEWIAFREILPAATAPLRLHDGREALLVTVLPTGWAALHRRDGVVLLGAQTTARSGDLSRDLAWALEAAFAAEPGAPVVATGAPGPGPRLQDLLADAPLEVTIHDDFGFWLPADDADGDAALSLEQANAAIVPTAAVPGATAAYWCRIRQVLHLRWVLPYAEEAFFDAAARLQAAGELGVGEGTHFVGTFRAHGLVAPVWDLAPDTTAEDLAEPVAALRTRLEEALARTEPLTGEERRQRSGLMSRQLTLR